MRNVLLASGGLDSTVLAAMYPGSVHLTVDYGQRHCREISSAKRVAAHYEAEQVTIACDLDLLSQSSLTGYCNDPEDWEGTNTVVPGRNSVLLSFAVALAASRKMETVMIGCNADDYEVYADCRPEFIKAWSDLAFFQHGVSVMAPLVEFTKKEIGRMARELDVPIDLTWSCYRGGAWPCEECGACAARRDALGVYDH